MKTLIITIAVILCSAPIFCAELSIKGKVDSVTVYRGQALITRSVDIKSQTGLQEIVVTELPARIIPGSIYAEADEGVEVRSVLYRERAVDKDIREEVRKLDEQIRQTQDKLQATKRHAELFNENKSYLAKLEQFTAPTATFELTKGVLNAETLQKITTYQFEQRKTIADEELKLVVIERDLNEQLSTLQRQRNEITGGSAKTVREALVFVNLPNAEGKLRLRYLVDQASWAPSYNIRTDAKREKTNVEYSASIQQLSGEDWSDIQMTLSTATPSLVARAPLLTPLTVTLSPLGQSRITAANVEEYGNQKEQIEQRKNRAQLGYSLNAVNSQYDQSRSNSQSRNDAPVVQTWNIGNSISQQPALITLDNEELNVAAGELQVLDLVAKGKIGRNKMEKGRSAADESVSVTYELPGRTSLPSRASEQLIQIAALPMKGQFYKVAIPLLTKHVYEEALLTNEGKMVLLSGPASTFVAQQFVGRGEVPTVAVGESFTVGFGIDTSFRAERELLEKTESVQGGNRVLSFSYLLQIENFGTEASSVRVLDRLPTAKESEVRVTPVTSTPEISKDAMYEKNEHKKGILRWDATVPAQAIGTKALGIQYQFQLEYDRQMGIAGIPVPSNNPNAAPGMIQEKLLKK